MWNYLCDRTTAATENVAQSNYTSHFDKWWMPNGVTPDGHQTNTLSRKYVEKGKLAEVPIIIMQFNQKAKPTMTWQTNLGHCYPEKWEKKLCFLCPVGLKEENLFTKAWKYFITSSRGRSVLMTRSTGLWQAAGFLKLQRTHWSPCQAFGAALRWNR